MALALGLTACGAASRDDRLEPRSSFDDPPPATTTPTAIVDEGGRDQAHDLVLRLVEAIVAEDETGVASLLDARIASAAPRSGDAPSHLLERRQLVRQLLAAARAAHLPADVELGTLIEAGSVEVIPARTAYERDSRPSSVEPTDLVVQFRVSPGGRRALAVLAPSGTGRVVVRPGTRPLVVAR